MQAAGHEVRGAGTPRVEPRMAFLCGARKNADRRTADRG